jgi:hypothetical protein
MIKVKINENLLQFVLTGASVVVVKVVVDVEVVGKMLVIGLFILNRQNVLSVTASDDMIQFLS